MAASYAHAPPHSCRILVRSSDYYLHGALASSDLGLEARASKEQVVAALGKETGLNGFFRPAHFPSIHEELLRIDEVRGGGEVMD